MPYLKRLFGSLAALTVAFGLAGCMSKVKSDVTAFSTLTEDDAGKAVLIAPYDEAQGSSLEWRSYAEIMATKLREKGFRVAERPDQADLVAFFGYAIDGGEQVQTTYSLPEWGVTGYSGAHTTGTVQSYGSFGTYSATTTLTPQYGVTGHSTHSVTSTVYTRSLAIDIIDAETGEKKWEMTLASTGRCGRFAAVAPVFFDAAFQSFPSGSGGTVMLDSDGNC